MKFTKAASRCTMVSHYSAKVHNTTHYKTQTHWMNLLKISEDSLHLVHVMKFQAVHASTAKGAKMDCNIRVGNLNGRGSTTAGDQTWSSLEALYNQQQCKCHHSLHQSASCGQWNLWTSSEHYCHKQNTKLPNCSTSQRLKDST